MYKRAVCVCVCVCLCVSVCVSVCVSRVGVQMSQQIATILGMGKGDDPGSGLMITNLMKNVRIPVKKKNENLTETKKETSSVTS